MLKCDPPIEARSPESDLLAGAGFQLVAGGGFGGVQPKAVMVLDLDGDLDKIFGGFKSKWRYNIRLADRKGVSIREAGRDDLASFYDLLVETARRDGFFIRGRSYFETLWDVLHPSGMLVAFLAELAGRPIAGILLLVMGDRATYTYGASSNEHRNVMPNHMLQWHGIRWAKERGCRVYDFRGVSPVRSGNPVEPSIAGLNRFKEGFGARYVEYAGEFDLPLRAGWYRFWRAAAPPAMALRRRLKGGGGAAQAD
jgi:lipid II:glycine glycyltransferase (peptidoglycan interpeptide bridge formation enzyme)